MRGQRATEDYLKTIYILSMHQEVHACMIAQELRLSRPTVSVFLRRLEADGFLRICQNKVIVLTDKGLKIAKPVYKRYQVLYSFLTGLGVSEKTAHQDACEMEHGLGEESYQALRELANTLKGK